MVFGLLFMLAFLTAVHRPISMSECWRFLKTKSGCLVGYGRGLDFWGMSLKRLPTLLSYFHVVWPANQHINIIEVELQSEALVCGCMF